MKISQREARRLKKRLTALQYVLSAQRRTYGQEWPGGVNIASVTYSSKDDLVPVAIRTARQLGHAVVVVGDESGTLRYVALRHPKDVDNG